MSFFHTKNIIFDKITAILTLTFQTLVSSIDWMCWGSWVRIGPGVRTGLGHGGRVLQTQSSSLLLSFKQNKVWFFRGFTLNIKSYFLWRAVKNNLWMLSAAVVIGALRVNICSLITYIGICGKSVANITVCKSLAIMTSHVNVYFYQSLPQDSPSETSQYLYIFILYNVRIRIFFHFC